MALSVKHGRLGIDDFDENITQMSRTQTFVRRAIAHLATASLTAVLTGGLSLEERTTALKDAQATFEQLAVYSGCAGRDQLGSFYWHPFPMAPQESEQTAPVKKTAKAHPR